MSSSQLQFDPLNSPHPVPWHWVLATHSGVSSTIGTGTRQYRTQSLISPDGEYAAYSRIVMQVEPELYWCQVSSIMFVENLQTGELHLITANSPGAGLPFCSNDDSEKAGSIAILIPIGWSRTGHQLLGRELEGFFCSSDLTDYAVIWNRHSHESITVAPSLVHYTHAILLGWSQNYLDRVLFRAGNMGSEQWSMLAVASDCTTVSARNDRPLIFGHTPTNVWAGPQGRQG